MNAQELRELDAFIAEKVIGYTHADKPGDLTLTGEKRYFISESGVLVSEPYLVGTPEFQASLPLSLAGRWNHQWHRYSPTTDPAAAMEVLERCVVRRTESWSEYRPDAVLAIYAPTKHWSNQWVVSSDAEGSITVEAKTLPIAICLFAKELFK